MSNFPTNGILQLEPLRSSHTEAFTDAVSASNANIRQWLGSTMALESLEAIADFVADFEQSWANETKYGFFVRELGSHRCVGFGFLNGVNKTHRFANLGYWVSVDATGQGYATMITHLLVKYGLETLDFYRLELVIEPDNLASIRVAEKAGAVREGLHRKRLFGRDAVVYGIIREDREQAYA